MKLPRGLSGENLAAHLIKHWQYEQVHQVGSHIIVQTQVPLAHRISVPAHKALRIGTLNSILASVATHKNVTKEAILKGI
jgi:predicted RNA binding protein YcfA (HicA-like mRNA interferase family)